MFRHVSIGVSDFKKSLDFYDRVMKTLGYDRLFGDEKDLFMAYGPEECFLCIGAPLNGNENIKGSNGTHFCFIAKTKEAVDNFYKTALEFGATSDGEPGIRKQYADDYYAAFVLDLDGHKIEAMARVKI